MKSVALLVQYDGTYYSGWQKQKNATTVQEILEKALFKITNHLVKTFAAGRTDAGVHAKEMIAHFETINNLELDKLSFQLNSFLPNDIAVGNFFKVKNDAHARFSAISRSYDYKISYKKNPLKHNRVYQLNNKLDLDQLNKATKILFNHSDFKSFSKSKSDVKTFNCNIMHAKWKLDGDILIGIFPLLVEIFAPN